MGFRSSVFIPKRCNTSCLKSKSPFSMLFLPSYNVYILVFNADKSVVQNLWNLRPNENESFLSAFKPNPLLHLVHLLIWSTNSHWQLGVEELPVVNGKHILQILEETIAACAGEPSYLKRNWNHTGKEFPMRDSASFLLLGKEAISLVATVILPVVWPTRVWALAYIIKKYRERREEGAGRAEEGKRGKKVVVWLLSHVWLCDPLDCSLSGPLSVRFPIREYWNGLPFPLPGDLSEDN